MGTGEGRPAAGAEVAVVIPAFNEAENLPHVVRAIPRTVCGRPVEVIVSVDGATDGTEGVARSLGCLTLVSPVNRGGGAALRSGFALAASRGAGIVVTMDGDGQHLPGDIERLVSPILAGDADFVIAARPRGRPAGSPPIRWAGRHVFNLLLRPLVGRRITDCASGFRAVRVTALERLTLREDRFPAPELLIQAARHGLRVVEVPVTMAARRSGRSKKPGPLRYGWGFGRTVIRTWWR